MTHEEAIKHFKDQLEVFGGEHHEAMKVAIEALEKQRWIPCSERLPDVEGAYLVIKETESGIRPVSLSIFLSDNTFAGSMKVVAWMPLPEPYKAGE